MPLSLVVAVVADALEERAIDIARRQGVEGVTILPARGINFPEHMTFFNLTFEGAEKVLLWITDSTTSGEALAAALNVELDLLKPMSGLAFVARIEHLAGLPVYPFPDDAGPSLTDAR
ncbi:MAG: transcriptional regulator [Rhodocyclaceae bacterium]